MAIDEAKLEWSPTLQQVFVDPDTAVAVVGSLYFYKNDDHTTLKPVYRHSGDPDNPFEEAPNPIDLDTAGALPYKIYLYPYDDEGNPELYYIKGLRPDDSMFWQLDFVADKYDNGGSSGGGDDNAENLFPSYGFDSQIYPELYATDPLPLVSGKNSFPLSLGWFLEVQTTDITQNITYSYTALNNSSLPGNPKNELTITVENATGGDTYKRLVTTIGYYNSFIDKALAMATYLTISTGSSTTLPVKVYREKAGVAQTPITVGTMTISGARTQRSITFTLSGDPIDAGGYSNGDKLYLFFDLPINLAFSLNFTGTWLQESSDGLITISERSASLYATKQIFSGAAKYLQESNTSVYAGFPLGVSNGNSIYIYSTGRIFSGSVNTANYPYAVDMNSDVELLAGKITNGIDESRLIAYLREAGGALLRSKNTIATSSTSATYIEFTTGLSGTEKTAWDASNCPSFTYSKEKTEWEMDVKAIQDPNSKNQWNFVRFVGKVNGAFTDCFYDPETSTSEPDTLFKLGSYESPAFFADYVGTMSWRYQATGASPHSFAAQLYVNDTIAATNGTGSTPMAFDLVVQNNIARTMYTNSGIPLTDGDLAVYDRRSVKYRNALYQTRTIQYEVDRGSPADAEQYPMGYFAWNGTTSGGTLPAANYILAPDYDGDGAPDAPAATITKKTFTVNLEDSDAQIAYSIAETINNAATHRFTYNATLPTSGQSVNYSSVDTDFILIFWNTTTTATKPANPDSSRRPVYAKYPTGTTAAELFTAMGNAVETASCGVPTPNALRLWVQDGLNYYMNLQEL